MKKFYFFLIAMLFSAVAFAYDVEIDGIYYNLDTENKTAEVAHDGDTWDENGVGYTQSEIVIPEKVNYNGIEYSVTSIGENAFYECKSLTSITIPNSIKYIECFVFRGCGALERVCISDLAAWCDIEFCWDDGSNPLDRGNLYLNGEKVVNLVIPEGVDSIKRYSLRHQDFLNVSIPNSVTYIGSETFYGCSSLTSLKIPNSVIEIGVRGFKNCSSLVSVDLGEGITEINDEAFIGCSSLTSIIIPNSVIYLGSEAFAHCYALKCAKIGSSINDLGNRIFACNGNYDYNDEISSLDTLICKFGNDIEVDIDDNFEDYDDIYHPLVGIKNLRYFEGPTILVNTISEGIQTQFTNKLTEVHITDGELDENGFNFINRSKKSLHTIDLAGTTNTTINDLAFYDCYKLENLALPKNLETIGYKAFADCKHLTELTIPASVTEIGESAFENCRSIDAINFAEGGKLETIGAWAFYNNHNLTGVTIPEGVKTIGDAAFYGCTYLDSLALPSTTQRIGDNCFALCSRMKQINVNATVPPTIFAKTFFDVNRNIPVIVPEGAREAYANDEYWGEFINVIESDEETQIENAENANVAIYSVDGMLYVDGLSADYQVFDVNGRLVYTGRDAVVSLPRGVYVVVVEGEVEKVVL